MDFYKEAKVLSVPSGATLDMSGATFNHQGAVIFTQDALSVLGNINIYFGSLGGPSTPITVQVNAPSGIGIGDMTTNTFGTSILKNRLIKINNNTSGAIKVMLLN